MLTVFGVDHEVGADQRQFQELCPAFIQQFHSGVCSVVKTTSAPEQEKDTGKSKDFESGLWELYTIGMLYVVM